MIALSFVSSAHAATIIAAGSISNNSGNEVTEWRTAGTSKTMDIDGDNIYGTFGGVAYGDALFGNMGYTSSQPQVGPFAGYATIDDVTIGAPDRQVKTTSNSAAGGTDVVMYTFTVTSAVSATETLRVGIMLDGLNGASFSPLSIGLKETSGAGTAEVATTANDGTIDMYFFDVTGGVTSGTSFQVFADASATGYVTHQAVALDVFAVPVPEPSSTALLGLGGLALILRRRK